MVSIWIVHFKFIRTHNFCMSKASRSTWSYDKWITTFIWKRNIKIVRMKNILKVLIYNYITIFLNKILVNTPKTRASNSTISVFSGYSDSFVINLGSTPWIITTSIFFTFSVLLIIVDKWKNTKFVWDSACYLICSRFTFLNNQDR